MLTAKKRRFVREYRVDGNGAKAAERAGYAKASAKVTACKLLKEPAVASAIANQEAEKANQAIADANERREILTRIARAGGNPVASIRAADVLNKMDGLYIERHEHSGLNGEPLEVIFKEVPSPRGESAHR